MKKRIASTALLLIVTIAAPGYTAGPPADNARNVFKMLLEQVDANKDGELSVAECMNIYTTRSVAEKNCTFWDVDRDGIIKEDEYVQQTQNIGKKH